MKVPKDKLQIINKFQSPDSNLQILNLFEFWSNI